MARRRSVAKCWMRWITDKSDYAGQFHVRRPSPSVLQDLRGTTRFQPFQSETYSIHGGGRQASRSPLCLSGLRKSRGRREQTLHFALWAVRGRSTSGQNEGREAASVDHHAL